ncbi:MAG TPA: cbb3-type cytochrome oxidase assembly protein CcoS [Holophagaceae bacterium]|nr:cbb3-type cytochrome oxidase assembly protein CcoS [Holophagaceae bacterium]
MTEGPTDIDLLDLLIVGAGPAGIATAVEARRAGIQRILLLEKGPGHSFSIEKLYTPGKRVDKVYLGQQVECEGSVCIVDGNRETVLEALDGFVREYGLEIRSGTEVSRITPLEGGGFEAVDARGTSYRARTVVIAIGVFGRPNKPDHPIPPTLKGHVHFDLAEGIPPGVSVLVVGGGNTALEYVEYLYAGRSVTLAYRGAEFAKANEVNRKILQDLEASRQATVWRNADIASLRDTGEAPRIEATFKDGRSARFDHAVFALGGATPEGFLRQAGVELDGRHPRVDHRFHSTVPGLFLAGDLVAGGKGSIVKAFNTGRAVVWEGLCQDHLECRIPDAGDRA